LATRELSEFECFELKVRFSAWVNGNQTALAVIIDVPSLAVG
jgi:hypothetical protein